MTINYCDDDDNDAKHNPTEKDRAQQRQSVKLT